MSAATTGRTRTKSEIIAHILSNDAYLPESGLYRIVAEDLAKLSRKTLQSLDLILVFRIKESEDLALQVSKILSDC